MKFKNIATYTLKKYISDFSNLIRAFLTLVLAFLAVKARAYFTNFPDGINWSAISLLFLGYLLVDLITKFVEEFRKTKSAYDGILDSILKQLNKDFHGAIAKNVVFRITLFLQKNVQGQKSSLSTNA
jgi:hypothetical protein